jgi:hypothetical protein
LCASLSENCGIDEQDVALADDHRRVDVVADLPLAGVHLERKLRLRGGGRGQDDRDDRDVTVRTCVHHRAGSRRRTQKTGKSPVPRPGACRGENAPRD